MFEDHSPWDGSAWLSANLDEPLLPSAEIVFGNRVKYTLPWTPEGKTHELNIRLVNCLNKINGRCRFFADTSGHVGWQGKRRTVTLPPFDGSVDDLEPWCHHVVRLMQDEE
jgi:hypothetical protein